MRTGGVGLTLGRRHSQRHEPLRLSRHRSMQVFLRVELELFKAMCAAEIIVRAFVRAHVPGRGGIYGHPTDRVLFLQRGCIWGRHTRQTAINIQGHPADSPCALGLPMLYIGFTSVSTHRSRGFGFMISKDFVYDLSRSGFPLWSCAG